MEEPQIQTWSMETPWAFLSPWPKVAAQATLISHQQGPSWQARPLVSTWPLMVTRDTDINTEMATIGPWTQTWS